MALVKLWRKSSDGFSGEDTQLWGTAPIILPHLSLWALLAGHVRNSRENVILAVQNNRNPRYTAVQNVPKYTDFNVKFSKKSKF